MLAEVFPENASAVAMDFATSGYGDDTQVDHKTSSASASLQQRQPYSSYTNNNTNEDVLQSMVEPHQFGRPHSVSHHLAASPPLVNHPLSLPNVNSVNANPVNGLKPSLGQPFKTQYTVLPPAYEHQMDSFSYGLGTRPKVEIGVADFDAFNPQIRQSPAGVIGGNGGNSGYQYTPPTAGVGNPMLDGGKTERQVPKKRKGTKRRTKNPASGSENSIRWEDLNIDENVASIVFSVLPKEKVNQFLNDGASSIMCTLNSHLTTEQQNAIKIVKQRLRAEKKSRREKQRRVHVNNSLMALATKINVKPEEQDMNSILIHAVKYIEKQQQEIDSLRQMLLASGMATNKV